jgi:hypothetical protein
VGAKPDSNVDAAAVRAGIAAVDGPAVLCGHSHASRPADLARLLATEAQAAAHA